MPILSFSYSTLPLLVTVQLTKNHESLPDKIIILYYAIFNL